ncbi:unnamed protein product [Phytophthora lilii]|uniref:Unnamed protein product n=1 Tax=Phytophthora lilii TaxID=2077276 RepID=A0A9W6U1J1_9STRA|nr:unnamed protein product [Phytophthora lilii]
MLPSSCAAAQCAQVSEAKIPAFEQSVARDETNQDMSDESRVALTIPQLLFSKSTQHEDRRRVCRGGDSLGSSSDERAPPEFTSRSLGGRADEAATRCSRRRASAGGGRNRRNGWRAPALPSSPHFSLFASRRPPEDEGDGDADRARLAGVNAVCTSSPTASRGIIDADETSRCAHRWPSSQRRRRQRGCQNIAGVAAAAERGGADASKPPTPHSIGVEKTASRVKQSSRQREENPDPPPEQEGQVAADSENNLQLQNATRKMKASLVLAAVTCVVLALAPVDAGRHLRPQDDLATPKPASPLDNFLAAIKKFQKQEDTRQLRSNEDGKEVGDKFLKAIEQLKGKN